MPYDLEDRTKKFAKAVRAFVKELPRTAGNENDIKQLVRASGSVGANYIEANENLGKKDFLMHIKICRKEAKESGYWLDLIEVRPAQVAQHKRLIQESTELMKIFAAILRKSE
jgi:four helix bundle protein